MSTNEPETAVPSPASAGRARRVASLLFPDDPGRRARRDRVLAFLFAVLAVVLVVRAAHKTVGTLVHNQEWGARFLARQDPYFDPEAGRRIHGPYPPSFALVTVPLALLSTPVARVVWCSLQVVALWFFLGLFRRRLREHWPALEAHASVLFAFALLLVSRYLLRDTAGGGGNLVYTLLAFVGVERALRGRETSAGLPLALSLVLKPNLSPLLLFLALRGRWRAAASTVVAAALLFALPGLYFGPRAYTELVRRWVSDVVIYEDRDDLHSSALVPDGMPPAMDGMNQSLREAVHRVLRPPGDSGADDVHLVTVSASAASWTARLLDLALLAWAALRARRARGERAEWFAALAFLPLTMLLSPITWKAHHVDLLLCFCALLALAASDTRRRAWLVPFLAGYWVLCDLFSEEIVGSTLRDFLQAFSIVTWLDIVLLALLLRFAARPAEA
jgi:hypothetical protein